MNAETKRDTVSKSVKYNDMFLSIAQPRRTTKGVTKRAGGGVSFWLYVSGGKGGHTNLDRGTDGNTNGEIHLVLVGYRNCCDVFGSVSNDWQDD